MDKHPLWPVYFTEAWRRLAVSLLAFFSSIYLYQTLGSLRLVFLFFLFLQTAKLVSLFWTEELALKQGLKKQTWLGQILMAMTLFGFFLSQKYPGLVFLAAVIWGISAGFYWFGWHGLMIKRGVDGRYGRALGSQEMVNLLPILISPILGGFLIDQFGYSALFGTALLAIVFSLLVLRPLPETRTHADTTPKEIFRLFKTHKRVFLAYLGDFGSANIYFIVFPLYLFLILKKELAIGEFFSFSLVLVAIFNFLIGRKIDLGGKKGLLGWGTIFSFFLWVGRFLSRGVNWLFFLDFSERVVEKMTAMPLNVLTYEKALDGGTGRAVLFRETAAAVGGIFACLLLILINDLRLAFIFGGILTLFPLLLVKKHGLYGDGHKT